MNKTELLHKAKRTRTVVLLVGFGIALYVPIVVFLLLGPLGGGLLNDKHAGVLFVVLAIVTVGDLIALEIISRTVSKRNGMCCPRCGYIFPLFAADRIVEANRCPRCGAPLYTSTGPSIDDLIQ